MSINDNIRFLGNMEQGFKRTISWNKHRSEITTQPRNNNLDDLIDPTFRNINRLFFRSKRVTVILQALHVMSTNQRF